MKIILCTDKIVSRSCLRKDFILGSINSEEKRFLPRGGAWDGLLIEDDCCLGSCHVQGHCLRRRGRVVRAARL